MRSRFAFLSSLLLASTLAAQGTLGVLGVNDYWVTPGGSPGSQSCKSLTVVTPTTINLNFSCAPSTPFVILFATCPCVACSATPPMGTSSCLPPPSSACPASNQFWEAGVIAPCLLIVLSGVSNTAGFASIPIPVPLASPPYLLSTQAAFLGPAACVVTPWSLLFSPAWNLSFI